MSHKDIQPQIKFYSSKDISSKNYEVPASQSLLFYTEMLAVLLLFL